MTYQVVLHRRDLRARAAARLTLALIAGVILLGALVRLLDRVALHRVGEIIRRCVLSPKTVARRIGVRSGMRVLLFASDEGETADAIAREVGTSGHVESVLADCDRAQRARQHLAESGVTNVNIVTAPPERIPFGDASFDAVCLHSAFGRTARPRDLLSEAWRVLRPAGRLSASDSVSTPAFYRRRTIERWGEGVGFESLEYFGNLLAYTVNFRKPLVA